MCRGSACHWRTDPPGGPENPWRSSLVPSKGARADMPARRDLVNQAASRRLGSAGPGTVWLLSAIGAQMPKFTPRLRRRSPRLVRAVVRHYSQNSVQDYGELREVDLVVIGSDHFVGKDKFTILGRGILVILWIEGFTV